LLWLQHAEIAREIYFATRIILSNKFLGWQVYFSFVFLNYDELDKWQKSVYIYIYIYKRQKEKRSIFISLTFMWSTWIGAIICHWYEWTI